MTRRGFPSDIMEIIDRIRNGKEKAPEEDIRKLAAFVLVEDARSGSAPPMTESKAYDFIEGKNFHITDRILGYRYISGELRSKPRSYLALVIPPGKHGLGLAADYLREYLDQADRDQKILENVKRIDSAKLIEEIQALLVDSKPHKSFKPD